MITPLRWLRRLLLLGVPTGVVGVDDGSGFGASPDETQHRPRGRSEPGPDFQVGGLAAPRLPDPAADAVRANRNVDPPTTTALRRTGERLLSLDADREAFADSCREIGR